MALFFGRPQDDQLHYSGGVGLAVKEDFQIDLAVDISELSSSFSFSLVWFFWEGSAADKVSLDDPPERRRGAARVC